MYTNMQLIYLLLTSLSIVSGHMQLKSPVGLRNKANTHSNPNTIDYSHTSPLSGAAAFPCKGYLSDTADPSGAGASVKTYTAGAPGTWSVSGSAVHGGGSCQISLAYGSDKFTKFTVIHSYEGDCPLNDGQEFTFTMPADAPTGPAVFSWTWFNKVGNREIYQDCAAITIAAGSGTPSVPFSTRPELFLANLGNGCETSAGTTVKFPNPGPSSDVTVAPGADTSGTFSGTCAPVKGTGNSGGSSPPAEPKASSLPATSISPGLTIVPVSSATLAPAFSAPASMPTTLVTSTSVGYEASPIITSTLPLGTGTSTAPGDNASGELTLSMDGSCGGSKKCRPGFCCSSAGFCGDSALHCGSGCNPAFGQCAAGGLNSTVTHLRYHKGRSVAGRV